LTKDREKIKSFSSFLVKESDGELLTFSTKQAQLNEICIRMRDLAPIENVFYQNQYVLNEEEIERGKQLFAIWHEAMVLILSQKHLYVCRSYGMKNLIGKPRRNWLKACEIRRETPQLLLKKINK
jgi:hypothetical protein